MKIRDAKNFIRVLQEAIALGEHNGLDVLPEIGIDAMFKRPEFIADDIARADLELTIELQNSI